MFEEKKVQKSDINNGGFQQQSNQAAENKQYHMNSQNDRRMIRLKAIEAICYYIEN
jgi:hypothetical protein